MGQLPKLTPEVEKAITDRLGATGLSFEDCCRNAGVKVDTALRWLQRGSGENKHRPPHPRYVHFVQAVAQARARVKQMRVAKQTQAGMEGFETMRETITRPDGTKIERVRRQAPDWRALSDLNEKQFPEEFGRRVIIKNEGGGQAVDWAGMVQDAWAMIRAEQAKRVGPGAPAALPAPAGAVNDSRRNGEPP